MYRCRHKNQKSIKMFDIHGKSNRNKNKKLDQNFCRFRSQGDQVGASAPTTIGWLHSHCGKSKFHFLLIWSFLNGFFWIFACGVRFLGFFFLISKKIFGNFSKSKKISKKLFFLISFFFLQSIFEKISKKFFFCFFKLEVC